MQAREFKPGEDYPDFVIPLAQAVAVGGRVVGPLAARDLVDAYLAASFMGEKRLIRRLRKLAALEAAQRATEEIRLRIGPSGRSREGASGQALNS
jgi:hypothetical protein